MTMLPMIIKYLSLVSGVVAVLLILLVFSILGKDKNLAKARLFLRFERLHKMHTGLLMIVMAGIALHLAYVASGYSRVFEPGMFMPFGAGVAAFHVGAIFISLAVYSVLRKE